MTERLSSTQTQEIEALCSALFDGSITPNQFRLLQVYLRVSDSSRRLFIQHRNLHGALAAACAYEVLPTHTYSGMPSRVTCTGGVQGKQAGASSSIDSASRTSSAVSTSGEPGPRGEGRRMVLAPLEVATKHVTVTSLSIAGLVTVLALLLMTVFTPPGRHLFERFATATPHEARVIARLIDVRECEWLESSGDLGIGKELVAGQKLNLLKGSAKIRYRNGVQILLQGPALFEMSRPGQGYLSSGKLSAVVPSAAIGYTVETPNARVVDLGTEFAVDVRPGEQSEVHVFRGCVDAQWLGESGRIGKVVSLTAGHAARFEFGAGRESISTFAANEGAFQRTMDRPTVLATKKASWREAIWRLRRDPKLVLYYTFSERGSNRPNPWEFANKASAVDKPFSCVWKGPRNRELQFVRGKWPWSAALDFPGDPESYLLVDRFADERVVGLPLGSTMSLVATVGSSRIKDGAEAKWGEAASDGVASLGGPVMMNRRKDSEDLDFQLAFYPSADRGRSGKAEFRLHGCADAMRRDARGERNPTSREAIVLSEKVELDCGRWHQIVAVCERLTVRLYWDGNQVGEQRLNEPLALQLDELSIGHGQSLSSEGKVRELGFDGLIDDLAVFKRPLEESEIRSMAELY